MTGRRLQRRLFSVESFTLIKSFLLLAVAGLVALLVGESPALSGVLKGVGWRVATESELRTIIPARAAVEKERIETEFRTNGKGQYIAGVVLITAGYSAEGKYSHFFLTQAAVKLGDFELNPGEYVFGFRHNEEALAITFYEASTGKQLGTIMAPRMNRVGRVESFHIYPPSEKSIIQIGRFGFTYEVVTR